MIITVRSFTLNTDFNPTFATIEAMNSESLQIKQEHLEILQPIVEEYTRYSRTDKIQINLPTFDSTSPFGIETMFLSRELVKVQRTLESLEQKGLIRIDSMFGTLDGIKVSILDATRLIDLYRELFESIPATGNLPRIMYSIKSGTGKINGQSFRFNKRSTNRKLFKLLLQSPSRRLNLTDVLKAGGHRGNIKIEQGAAIIEYNGIVTNLRAGLKGISTHHLTSKNQVMQLFADITLTD